MASQWDLVIDEMEGRAELGTMPRVWLEGLVSSILRYAIVRKSRFKGWEDLGYILGLI